VNIRVKSLFILFITALIIRILFSFYFQQFYFGSFEFKYRDGFTYLDPIVNLIKNGEYRGDYFLDDSKYFRPPLYPIFLGIVYLLVPEVTFDYVVAFIQCIIGAASSIFVYHIIFNIFKSKKTALISGALFAMYPFAILWTPLMYTETVQIFLMLLLVCLATNVKSSIYSTMVQGALVGLILLTKQYLALIIIIPIYIIIFTSSLNPRYKAIHLSLLILGLVIVLLPWTVRNYISSTNVIIFFGKTSGLRNTLDDAVAFTQFANKFDENTTEYMRSVVETGATKFAKHPVFLEDHKEDIVDANQLAHQCGGSFLERRNPTSVGQMPHRNCNKEVVVKFDELSAKFWREVPLWDALETRREALWKVISKSNLVNRNLSMNRNEILTYGLFKYRILLLILGFMGMLYIIFSNSTEYRQKVLTMSLLVTSVAFYLFFCLILVSAEMRYLLTPDLLISLFAGVLPVVLFRRMLPSSKESKIAEVKQL
jgi:4-amino-4-deoxy-L-arabinose transferase-like glycosyltransferase